jgi:hypothetical protein
MNQIEDRMTRAVHGAAIEAAEIIKEEIVRAYRDGVPGHQALHPFTVAMKGDAKPLFESGALADSVQVFVIRSNKRGVEISIGPPDGTKESMKAAIAEHGMVIRVTPKMRRFLAAHGLKLKSTTTTLFVPPRPVMKYAATKALDRIPPRVLDRVQIEIV